MCPLVLTALAIGLSLRLVQQTHHWSSTSLIQLPLCVRSCRLFEYTLVGATWYSLHWQSVSVIPRFFQHTNRFNTEGLPIATPTPEGIPTDQTEGLPTVPTPSHLALPGKTKHSPFLRRYPPVLPKPSNLRSYQQCLPSCLTAPLALSGKQTTHLSAGTHAPRVAPIVGMQALL